MIGDKKIIGVCLTKVNNRARAEYISGLYKEATNYGYKLMVFNSIKDFFNGDDYDKGSKSVFDTINYNIIDALIIFYDNFCDETVFYEIIQNAQLHGVPAIVVGAEVQDCYCVVRDYEDAYKEVIRHVIRDHNITDTCFVGGWQENDKETPIRIRCYKEVLEENGLPFSEDQIYYGGYWSIPTQKMVLDQLNAGKRPPRAIICANDHMAITICEILTEHGYRIPEDVAVTGFDGIPDGEFFYPKLTTCKEDSSLLAATCMEVITGALNKTLAYGIFKYKYTKSIHQSCGCTGNPKEHWDNTSRLFQMTRDLEQHEAHLHSWLDRMLECKSNTQLIGLLRQCILPDSYICLNPYLLTSISKYSDENNQILPKEFICISSEDEALSYDDLPVISLEDTVPNLAEWTKDNSLYVINSLFVGSKICGYYAAKVTDIFDTAHKINRIVKTINIAFNSILNQLTQKYMKLSIENAAHSNPITGIPNLKGAASWFEDFSFIEKNHNRTLTIAVYSLPKYKYIYENYGMQDVEEILCMVARNLELANPEECFIAHTSEDEFVAINYFADQTTACNITDEATTAFLSAIDQYNSTSGKDYFVEVNTGYTIVPSGWAGSLASYIRLASNEMYIKRIKSGMSAVVKEQNIAQDYYSAFNLLLEMNLFNYHFQPIVDAKTGDIYAYEALMRPDSSIGMNPLQVLETASVYKRLYDVEKATIFNVMERFSNDFDKFSGRKVFINSIPGHFLNETDNKIVSDKYSDYMKYVVFEITEQNSVSDEELAAIKRVGNAMANNHIAIDDYGTGHSNIVNLMRYTPQIIKIDRFLISGIHRDVNKQMFVRSTIEFARLNKIQVLAEGVETSEELRTVIDLGVDYVQGYYTARPAAEPLANIAEEIRNEIKKANYISA